MKKYLKNKFIIIGLICLIIFSVMCYNNDYMEYKQRKCIVIDKLITNGGYKYSGRFYLILKEERGIVFDLDVSPSTFSQSKICDIKFFNLRQSDIKQDFYDNLIYIFGISILGGISFTFIIIGSLWEILIKI